MGMYNKFFRVAVVIVHNKGNDRLVSCFETVAFLALCIVIVLNYIFST